MRRVNSLPVSSNRSFDKSEERVWEEQAVIGLTSLGVSCWLI
jgi:hypothetical protein